MNRRHLVFAALLLIAVIITGISLLPLSPLVTRTGYLRKGQIVGAQGLHLYRHRAGAAFSDTLRIVSSVKSDKQLHHQGVSLLVTGVSLRTVPRNQPFSYEQVTTIDTIALIPSTRTIAGMCRSLLDTTINHSWNDLFLQGHLVEGLISAPATRVLFVTSMKEFNTDLR